MKILLISFFCLATHLNGSAQDLNLETSLDSAVNETSGLLFLNNTLITHNDSGNSNELYEIDIATGAVTRTVIVTNASNIDWEDLTHDDTYIYIGDFGNYSGSRTDLKIYRVAISDYFSSTAVSADIINFSYSAQTDFSPNPIATNLDAEGLIHYNDKLYIFSKNWIDGNTNIYELPKVPGTYSLSIMDTIPSQGLISGATYNSSDNSIMLCGYGANGSFLIQLNAFNSGLFSNGNIIKTVVNIPENYSFQIEGITPINTTDYYLSAEVNSNGASGLFSFISSTLTIKDILEDDPVLFYPNPAEQNITFNVDNVETEIYSISGQLIKIAHNKQIDISDLTAGIYLMKLKKPGSDSVVIKRLVVKD